jgi:hypothetical protein
MALILPLKSMQSQTATLDDANVTARRKAK